MEKINVRQFSLKNWSIYTIGSVLLLLSGIGLYLYWGARYGVWYDIGIYSVTIILVLFGLFSTLLTLYKKTEE